MIRRLLAVAIVALMAVAGAGAQAGQTCVAGKLTDRELARRVEWAVTIFRTLDEIDPELALIARVGDDVRERGLKYTHGGFVWRDHPKGRWGLVHMLNECGTPDSQVYDQGLVNFLLDDPFMLDVLILVPEVGLQRAIVGRIRDGTGARFNHPIYSMTAYPFSDRYQNSNQWLLEVLAAAQGDLIGQTAADRAAAQNIYAQLGYRGSIMRIAGFARAMAALTRKNVHFDDHPIAASERGEYQVVTVASIRNYLRRNRLLIAERELVHAAGAIR